MGRRQRVNVISFLVSIAILFVSIELSSESFATRINKISETLDERLSDVIDGRKPNFTELVENGTYVSDTHFSSKAMAGLYNFTNAFMDLIFSKDLYPEGFVTIGPNNQLQLADYQKEWKSLLSKYWGLLVVLIILIILLVFLPLCGFCFCFCRCCGKCGARSQPFDKKHDLCKKIILATLLIALGTLLLFGVVCAFVTNQELQQGTDELPTNLRKGIDDVNTYLDQTQMQINILLGKDYNYGEFETVLLATINNSSEIVYHQLEDYTKAISMTEVANIVNALPDIRNDFSTLKYSTNTLRVYASQLSDAVRKIKKDMLEILNTDACMRLEKCREISSNVSSLQTNIHFNNLPDITSQISQLDAINEDNRLFEAVSKGKGKLEEIKTKIGEAVNGTLAQARTKIDEAGQEIQKNSQSITDVVRDLKVQINDQTKPAINTADDFVSIFGQYRYYVALAISCLLLLISLFIALGLICGICGKRPDGYGDDCCNKGTGSSFLICGVHCMFFTGFIIVVVVIITFVFGIVAQRVVCDPLRDPSNSQLFREIVDKVDLTQFHIDFPLSQALQDCYQNKSIYQVFRLQNKFNLSEVKDYLNKFKINEILDNLDLSSLEVLKDFTILNDTEKELLKAFAKSKFADINFDEFKDLLKTTFTSINLTDLSNQLESLISKIEEDPTPTTEELMRNLQVNKLNIDMYQDKIIEPMKENASAVIVLAENLETQLNLNHSSFNEAMNVLINEIETTEDFIRTTGFEFLNKTIYQFTNGIINLVQTYIDRVVNKTETEIGKCGPLNLVIQATLTSTCDKILLPWNGFWFGLFWSVILFIPTIIVSVKLATLYQKHSAYSRELIETEYLYDAYVDRDNIPLNSSRGGSKSKKKNKKHKRYEDRPAPSSGADMVSREYSQASTQDARYADMAPKQWEDFPAGGPPQYQRAPTEYERPPPYYYPGAGETTAQ